MTTKKSSGSSVEVSSGAGVKPTVPSSTGSLTTIAGAEMVAPTNKFEVAMQKMLQGFQNFVAAGSTFPSASGGFSQATVIAQLEAALALYPAVVQAKKATSQALATLRAATPAAQVLMQALKDALIGFYGRGNPTLAEFGLSTKARAKATGLQNAVKAAKARQTRLNNGTLGKKQKAQRVLAAEAQSVASTLVPQGAGLTLPPASPAAPAKPTTSGQ